MAKKVTKKVTKKRVKKNVERGQAHIQSSFNNTIAFECSAENIVDTIFRCVSLLKVSADVECQ